MKLCERKSTFLTTFKWFQSSSFFFQSPFWPFFKLWFDCELVLLPCWEDRRVCQSVWVGISCGLRTKKHWRQTSHNQDGWLHKGRHQASLTLLMHFNTLDSHIINSIHQETNQKWHLTVFFPYLIKIHFRCFFKDCTLSMFPHLFSSVSLGAAKRRKAFLPFTNTKHCWVFWYSLKFQTLPGWLLAVILLIFPVVGVFKGKSRLISTKNLMNQFVSDR